MRGIMGPTEQTLVPVDGVVLVWFIYTEVAGRHFFILVLVSCLADNLVFLPVHSAMLRPASVLAAGKVPRNVAPIAEC